MSNAYEFIKAYNLIDAYLRAHYRGKGTPGFSDLVRRTAAANSVIAKYEDELTSFAKLRNAIVHDTVSDRVIAEPCDDATALIRRIADLLTAPPRLKDWKRRAPVVWIEGSEPLSEAAKKIAKSGYSNLPVYRGKRFLGIINNRVLVRALGNALEQGERAEAFLARPSESVLAEEDMLRYYRVLKESDTVQDAIDAFNENRKLSAVVVTGAGGGIQSIITASDLPRLIAMTED